jgi:hypothetical protein
MSTNHPDDPDEQPGQSEPKKNSPAASNPNISIQAGTSVNTGDITVGDKITTTYGAPSTSTAKKPVTSPPVKSAWANGLFYLVVFVVVIGSLAWLARMVEFSTLVVITLAGLLAVPLVGAFQLRMDDRLKEKSFMELVRLVLQQLPLIGKAIK